jgi:glycosyltransferase involved in cell wall biosynthesis
MNVAMVTSWDRSCGIYTYTRPLVEELQRQGHHVDVICHTDARQAEGVHPVMDLARADWFEAVEDAVDQVNPDVVHVQFEYGLYAHQRGPVQFFNYNAANSFGVNDMLFRWRVAGRPAVVTMHSDNSDRPDRLAFIRTMGELTSLSLVHTEHGPVPSGKVAFIPHATPAAPPHRELRAAKARRGWQGRKVVGMIGYPDWYKRYDRVVRLWPAIKEAVGPEALLIVACAPRPGSEEGIVLGQALTDAIEASPARDSIVNMPELFSPREFLEMIAAFDVLALPYQSAAASGPCMAACAVGTPVVVSRVGGLRSYVEDSGAGLAVARDNDGALIQAVARLLRDDRLHRELSVRARRYARRVSLPNVARRHVTFYRWAVAHRRSLAGAG